VLLRATQMSETGSMVKRSSKKARRDFAQNALRVVEIATGAPLAQKKNPAAVALGKLGGVKGGNARAAKLTADERKAIAKKGATARWKKYNETGTESAS
jgi:hypothetical protein